MSPLEAWWLVEQKQPADARQRRTLSADLRRWRAQGKTRGKRKR